MKIKEKIAVYFNQKVANSKSYNLLITRIDEMEKTGKYT